MGYLTSLVVLQASGVKLRDSVPSSVGYLTRLSLGSNKLTGAISKVSAALSPSVQYVDLGGNSLSGPISADLGLLTSLKYLDVHCHGMTGLIPTTLVYLTQMSYFNLDGNSLSGSLSA